MFRLSSDCIDCDKLRAEMDDVRSGAFVSFEGRVRNHNDGRAVNALEYEAYGELAVKEGETIVAEAKQKFQVTDVVCVHRTGALKLGEVAVWVGATSAHRDAAFLAVRYVIDEVKSRVPIWKKEHYADGHSDWVNCAHAHVGENEEAVATDYRLDALSLSMRELAEFELIDVREADEDPSYVLTTLLRRDVRKVPLSTINIDDPGLDRSKRYIFICQRGARSENLVAELRSRGYSNTFCLVGGAEALRRKFIA